MHFSAFITVLIVFIATREAAQSSKRLFQVSSTAARKPSIPPRQWLQQRLLQFNMTVAQIPLLLELMISATARISKCFTAHSKIEDKGTERHSMLYTSH